MKINKRAVLRLLQKQDYPLSAQQIRRRLGIKKQQVAKLTAWLHKLIQKGKVVQKGNLYTVPEVLESSIKAGKGSPKAVSSGRTKKASPSPSDHSDSRLTGIFSKMAKGVGYVDIPNQPKGFLIRERDQGGALNGDRVEVHLLGRRGYRGRTRGRIIRIVERKCTRFLGKLVRGKQTVLALPVNRKLGLPSVIIPSQYDIPDIESDALVEVELLPEQQETKDYFGRIIRILNDTEADQLGFNLILTENNIRLEFSKDLLDFAKTFPTRVVFAPESGRVDQRQLGYVTIDGKTARDFDDAVYVEKTDQGDYRLYVAIADVAHYVRPGNPIDEEAYLRGTSVYFPTHAIPMLPEALSNHLCSLKPKVNRLTLTCEMLFSPEGELNDYSIYESMIRSQARLVYDDVEIYLNGDPSPIRNPRIQKLLKLMNELAQVLSKKRYQRGAVNFNFPDFNIELDHKNRMVGMSKDYQSNAMKLIEQFMLEANETVARHCERCGLPVLYRVHDKPDMVKLGKFQKTFWHFGVTTPLDTLEDSKNFNLVFEQIEAFPNRDQLQLSLLKTMALACYRTQNDGHFGLAATHYAHFTSPIRRYPDLIVHRALKAHLKARRTKMKPRYNQVSNEIAEHLSQQERLADTAERQSLDLMKTVFLEKHIGDIFKATVTSIEAGGIKVELDEYTIEWFIPLEILDDDLYQYNPVNLSITGSYRSRKIGIGDQLMLQLVRVDCIHREMDFSFENWIN